MARVVVFIDGFNVYHSIARKPHLNQAKWLNYHAFAQQFVKAPDTLDQVLLFTSYTFGVFLCGAAWTADSRLGYDDVADAGILPLAGRCTA